MAYLLVGGAAQEARTLSDLLYIEVLSGDVSDRGLRWPGWRWRGSMALDDGGRDEACDAREEIL